ncbi:hypothetical protein GGX14DRAFT_367896 [Mycena pura]|uniref:ubiquitinyl hydrolase 1 n=1 Tax=Mycena pura TaxID=153505 RepID=A0AAD6V874_9AGAR|nr:hypothetical protein GGX14DRAFT_367896 [Mycena pura]
MYGPPPPPAVAWGTPPHQPQSPLPKDLLSPLHDVTFAVVTPTYYPTPPPDVSPLPQPSVLREFPSTTVPSLDNDTAAKPTAPLSAPQLPPASSLSSLPVSHEQVDALTARSSSTFLSPSTSFIGDTAGGTSSASSGAGGWAIWSRRPLNPAHAPGIIISSRAHPPLDVLSHALDDRTPPASPVLHAADVQAEGDVERGKDGDGAEGETETPSSNASLTDATDATGARTPTTTATTIPSSPVSISASTSASESAPVAPAPADSSPSASPPTDDASSSTPAPSSAAAASAPASVPQDTPAPSPSVAVASAAAAVAPPPKKSWASLLRAPASPATAPSPSATGAAPRPKWSGLPTSSVVGFSVPASAPPPPAEPVNRAALLALLAGGAAPPTTAPARANFAAAAAAGARAGAKTQAQAQAPTRISARGLVNTGNMCFANAVLQVLVYCPAFVGLFARLQALLGEEGDGAGEGEGAVLGAAPMVRATGAFLREFVRPAAGSGSGKGKGKAEASEEEEEEEAFIPTGVYDALKGKKRFDHMRGGHQEDAEEFLGFYLDTLEEELLAVAATLRGGKTKGGGGVEAVVEEREEEAPTGEADGWLEVGKKNRTVVTRTIKTAESPITHIFGGKFRSTLRAPGQKDSVIVEDWRSLRLDIQRDGIHTIQDALALTSQPQSVQITHPSRPGVVVEASQQVLIESLPSVLVLHIKRFCYDTTVGGVVKVGKQIAFTPELSIASDVMAQTATARKRGPTRYKLFGAIYHHGASASGGHYTLDVLHPTRSAAGEGWVRIDDELVSDVRPMDVFGGAVAGRDDTRCAYLLFYRRIR